MGAKGSTSENCMMRLPAEARECGLRRASGCFSLEFNEFLKGTVFLFTSFCDGTQHDESHARIHHEMGWFLTTTVE